MYPLKMPLEWLYRSFRAVHQQSADGHLSLNKHIKRATKTQVEVKPWVNRLWLARNLQRSMWKMIFLVSFPSFSDVFQGYFPCWASLPFATSWGAKHIDLQITASAMAADNKPVEAVTRLATSLTLFSIMLPCRLLMGGSSPCFGMPASVIAAISFVKPQEMTCS